MVQEACMIICDGSEYMRNGDHAPSRFDAQKDAVNLICGTKSQLNVENTVGLILMNGEGKADVLMNCTADPGKILNASHQMEIGGESNCLVALQTAQLALKHRKNKQQAQRIIFFVGSPVTCVEKQLIKAGKRLKKNKISVDVINFGEDEGNATILESFHAAVNSNDTSHLITIPRGGPSLTMALTNSTILGQTNEIDAQTQAAMAASAADAGGGGAAGGGGGGGGAAANQFAEYGGIDPNVDPELAMAIRMSLEEERARHEANAEASTANAAEGGAAEESKQNEAETSEPDAKKQKTEATQDTSQASQPATDAAPAVEAAGDDFDDDDEEALLAAAIAMSMDENLDAADKADGVDETLQDPGFLDDLLEDLPGVSKDDINMQDLLDTVPDTAEDEDDKDKQDTDKDK